MTKRRKNILFIQIFIFVFALIILFTTYGKKNNEIGAEKKNRQTEKVNKDSSKIENFEGNKFKDVEYKGIDLNGNRYILKSNTANFKTSTPEIINMQVMNAVFYFKDGTILKVKGDYGFYNNKINDIVFRDNIEAVYEGSYIWADKLDYLNSKNLLTISGNVTAESIQGDIEADKLNFNLTSKTLDITMFDSEQVKVKIKEK